MQQMAWLKEQNHIISFILQKGNFFLCHKYQKQLNINALQFIGSSKIITFANFKILLYQY